MKEIKTDRRVRRTQNALKTNLLMLMKEQPIQKISVSRLCEKSDINRSTFYTYYSSPMDLLHSIEEDILYTLKEDIEQLHKEISVSQLMDSITSYISSNRELIRLIFSDNGDPDFLNQLTLHLQEQTVTDWHRRYPSCTKEELTALHIFISRGCIGIIEQWIRSDFRQTADQISRTLEILSQSAASGFLKLNV